MLMAPSDVPWEQRETAAALMAADLLGEARKIEPIDTATMVIHSLFQSKAWTDARKFAGDRPDLIPELMVLTLPQVLEAMRNGLAGLDWSELSEEDRRRTEDLLEGLLSRGGGRRGGDRAGRAAEGSAAAGPQDAGEVPGPQPGADYRPAAEGR